MSKATIKRFLMLLSSARDLEREQLYQLLDKAEHCYCLKDSKGQYEFGKALSLFASPFDLIGDYYQSVHLHKAGQKQAAIEKVERVRQETKGMYADKALLTLSSMKEFDNDIDEALKLRFAASKSQFLPIHIEAAIGIASILSSQGEHQKAIEQLERVLPLINKLGNVPLPFDVLNSYATELAEVGKIELASKVITPVIISPYAAFYPNWPETGNEIYRKSRRSSMVSMPKVRFEKAESEATHESKPQASTVLPFRSLKEAPEPIMPDKLSPQEMSGLSSSQKRELVLAAIRTGSFSPFDYDRFMAMVGLLEVGPADKIIDLEDEQLIDDIGVIWANHVGPEEFAAVLSALRDCKDESRRNGIIDTLIKKAFQQSHRTRMSEEAWRLEVERRLPEK